MIGATSSKVTEKKQEALGVLEALEQAPVDLRLLEASQIAWAVSGLKDHQCQHVASLARSISDKWHTLATKALDKANAVLSQSCEVSPSGFTP
ncbi:hypothetical protein DUNSADRAFT_6418 [Dunaliella salina]|uniref:TFIIS N-terminal domain-containing protein n=1 Tax=Dunaliella salina TaxID=3046 RepID=A0ABQ7H6W5_DUNSA|nr:hypothetical protein DUNSADRAFT_6418 [Dunaliella salina]|eukprot:KAF5842568.1 hypothetical protein DUNSADRAFT_6418 [Dunaliella salina]